MNHIKAKALHILNLQTHTVKDTGAISFKIVIYYTTEIYILNKIDLRKIPKKIHYVQYTF